MNAVLTFIRDFRRNLAILRERRIALRRQKRERRNERPVVKPWWQTKGEKDTL